MRKNNLSKTGKLNNLQRQRDPIPWRYCFMTIVCGLILTAGFFFAARQHFSAIEYGIKNAKLRQQKGELENVQRQLFLNKEIALSPVEVKKAAKKIGFQEFAANSMQIFSRKIENGAASVEKIADRKLSQGFLTTTPPAKDEKPKTEKNIKEDKENKTKTPNNSADNIRPRVVGK